MTDPARWQHIRELFDEARAHPPSARAELLARRCGTDVDLRGEVESLLAADAEPGALDRLGGVVRSLTDLLDEAPQRAGPYEVLEEAGRGGMGVVYRARDPRLDRDVALKFLPAHLVRDGAARARFVAEARAASALDHPGICTVYDIGSTADGHLYIAMAWYGGGTLADRLKAGPLDRAEALRVAGQVAAALARAHAAGLVHRDIKPANIAFTSSGDVRILDFGIAALEAESTAEPAGTPRYMAPEQVQCARVDRRADVWALGAVLYEMLAGRSAVQGVDRDAVAAATIRVARGELDWTGIPHSLVPLIGSCLSQEPDQRPDAAALMGAFERASRPALRTRMPMAAAVAIIAVIGVTMFARERAELESPEADPNTVAVIPFRVSGDASLEYLRDGMVDLMSAALPGGGGLRAVDPRAVHNARSRSNDGELELADARALARTLRAGKLLWGEVAGTSEHIVISTTLTDLRGRSEARATAQGSPASLTILIDSLTAQLLSLSAGVESQRLSSLMTTSLPALREYLEGQASYRRGRYEEALRSYVRALELDSTFAVAGLALELAGGWVGGAEPMRERARQIAWRHGNRLSAADRALMAAAFGPDYPQRSTVRRTLQATEAALQLAPERVELWYLQADALLHFGRVLDIGDWEQRAEAGFRRAIELDSSFAQPMHHLILLYARTRQLDAMDAAAAVQLAREPTGSTADFIRWLRAAAHGQASTVTLTTMSVEALGWLAMIAQDDGLDTALGVRAAQERARRPATSDERFERNLALHAAALNLGRPNDALAVTERLRRDQPDDAFYLRLRILDALYADGDTDAGAAAATELANRLNRNASGSDLTRLNRCVVEQWLTLRGGVPHVPTTAPGQVRKEEPSTATHVCEAAAAALREAYDVRRPGSHIANLDSLLVAGPFDLPVADGSLEYAHLALAHAYEAAGQTERARVAIQRRVYFLGWQAATAATLREQARLALLAQDSAGAARATIHYLALRTDPELSLQDEVQSMQRQRAALSRH